MCDPRLPGAMGDLGGPCHFQLMSVKMELGMRGTDGPGALLPEWFVGMEE